MENFFSNASILNLQLEIKDVNEVRIKQRVKKFTYVLFKNLELITDNRVIHIFIVNYIINRN